MISSMIFGYIVGTLIWAAIIGTILLYVLPSLMPIVGGAIGLLLTIVIISYFGRKADERAERESTKKFLDKIKEENRIAEEERIASLKAYEDKLWDENFGNAYKKE